MGMMQKCLNIKSQDAFLMVAWFFYWKKGGSMRKLYVLSVIFVVLVFVGTGFAADVVPNEIMMPGTQPEEVTMESIGRCLNCHSGYETNPRVEPGFGWMGSAMGNAGRDPIF
jgi:hypothetical protein